MITAREMAAANASSKNASAPFKPNSKKSYCSHYLFTVNHGRYRRDAYLA
jgi:hypothetical protein